MKLRPVLSRSYLGAASKRDGSTTFRDTVPWMELLQSSIPLYPTVLAVMATLVIVAPTLQFG